MFLFYISVDISLIQSFPLTYDGSPPSYRSSTPKLSIKQLAPPGLRCQLSSNFIQLLPIHLAEKENQEKL